MSELYMDIQDMLENGVAWQNIADTLNVPISWVEEVASNMVEFDNE